MFYFYPAFPNTQKKNPCLLKAVSQASRKIRGTNTKSGPPTLNKKCRYINEIYHECCSEKKVHLENTSLA